MIREVIDVEPNLQVMDCWKSFNIADAVTFLEASMDELNTEKFNACWENLWSEAVHYFNGFLWIHGEVKRIMQTAREVVGEGSVEMADEEVEEHIEGHQEVLTHEEVEDWVKSSAEEEE